MSDSRFRSVLLVAGALLALLSACGDEKSPAGPSVLLLLANDRVTAPPRPDTLAINWLSDSGYVGALRDYRVPVTAGDDDWLGSFLIEGDDARAGARRIFVRGLLDGAAVSLCWIECDLIAGAQGLPVSLTLKPFPSAWDQDDDGVPDAVDNCPATSNPDQLAAASCL